MDRLHLLALVVIATIAGGLLVGWLGVLATNIDAWLPNAVGYVTIATVCLLLLVPIWYKYERERGNSA